MISAHVTCRIGFPTRLRNAFAFLLLAALILITGCTRTERDLEQQDNPFRQPDEVKTAAPSEYTVQPSIDPTTGKAVPLPTDAPLAPSPTKDLVKPQVSQDDGSEGKQVRISTPEEHEDYRNKCDIYWHLNWLRKELLRGVLPYDLPHMVKMSRQQMETARHDSNYRLADAALSSLEEALQNLTDQRTLRALGVETRDVPWSSGADSVQRYFQSQQSGLGVVSGVTPRRHTLIDEDDSFHADASSDASSPVASPSPALTLALAYATRYHASPAERARQNLEEMIRTSNRLRDELGLRNRKENNDGDRYQLASDLGQSGQLLGGSTLSD